MSDEAAAASEDALVAYFLALPAAARREYEALAERDRRFGEDVAAERRAGGEGDAGDTGDTGGA